MLFYIHQFMATWLLPPGLNLILALLGLFICRYRLATGKILISISLLSLWLLSTPLVAKVLIDSLQNRYAALKIEQLSYDPNAAIVVLEAGINLHTPEYGEPIVTANTLTRIHYAAFLHKKTNAPILVSGNDPTHPDINQTDYMAKALYDYFKISARFKEDNGYNTAQEGILSTKILKNAGFNKIYLVTHAYHMPRSVYAFQHKGLEIIPAPTNFQVSHHPLGLFSNFLPSIGALDLSTMALHEYVGIAWYRARYQF